MATTSTNSTTFQPVFKRMAQQGRHDDTFVVLAMLTGKTTDSIFRQAEGLGLPKIGPFHACIPNPRLTHESPCHLAVGTITTSGSHVLEHILQIR